MDARADFIISLFPASKGYRILQIPMELSYKNYRILEKNGKFMDQFQIGHVRFQFTEKLKLS